MKVILIIADTFRRDHLGIYGNRWIHTPNLNRLAGEAAVFQHHYIGSFPTVPNRRDVLLGQGEKVIRLAAGAASIQARSPSRRGFMRSASLR